MPNSAKVAISLPSQLVKRLERERKKTGESRSAFVQRALTLAFSEEERAARIERYLQGYRDLPETPSEIKAAEAAAADLLAQEPWE